MILTLLACTAALAAPYIAAKSIVPPSLQAAYRARDVAATQKNLEATLACYSTQFTFISLTGKTSDRSTSQALLAALFDITLNLTLNTQLQSVALKPGMAVVSCKESVYLMLPPDKYNPRYHAVKVRDVTRDVWTSQGNTWKLVKSQTLARSQQDQHSWGDEGPAIGNLRTPTSIMR